MDLRQELPKLTIANASQSAFTEWCDEQIAITAHDNVAPSAPLLSAAIGNQQCILTLTKPTTDVNGKTNTDFDHFKVYYKGSSGVTTGEPSITTKSTNHAFSASARTYFKAAAVDIWGNESALSAEDDAIPAHDAAEIISNVPLDISSYNIIDDGNVVVGDHMIGVIFEPVPTSFVGFAYWKLYYSKNDGGWGAYVEIKNSGSATGHVGSIGFNFKYESGGTALDNTKVYKFKLTAVDIDDVESTTGCIADGVASAGYTPNAADNSAVISSIVMGTTIIATNEIRGEHIYAGSTIEIASSGKIFSGDLSGWTPGTGSGWQFGDDSGTSKFVMGDFDNSKYLYYDGTNVGIVGGKLLTGTLTGARMELTPSGGGLSHALIGYDSFNTGRIAISTLTGIGIDDASGNNGFQIQVNTGVATMKLAQNGSQAQLQLYQAGSYILFASGGSILTSSGTVTLKNCVLDLGNGSSVSGTLTTANIPAISSAMITSLDATKLTATINTARLPATISKASLTLTASSGDLTLNSYDDIFMHFNNNGDSLRIYGGSETGTVPATQDGYLTIQYDDGSGASFVTRYIPFFR